MAQAVVLQAFVNAVGRAVVVMFKRVFGVVFGGRFVLGVPFDCFSFDELPSLEDLFLSTAYSEMNTTNKMISTRNNAAKSTWAFEGFRVSGS